MATLARHYLTSFSFPRRVQVALFAACAVGYVAASVAVFRLDASGSAIVAGSLLGAFPVFLVELRRVLMKPHLIVEERTVETSAGAGPIVRYPALWLAQERPVTDGSARIEHDSANVARAIVTVRNDGWGTAESCRVDLGVKRVDEDGSNRYTFPTRWQREDNPLELDLAPGDEAEVALFEIDLADGAFKTALSSRLPDSDRERAHTYARAERFEITPGPYRVDASLTASNTAVVSHPVTLGIGPTVGIPDGVRQAASDWGIVASARDDDRRAWATVVVEDGEPRVEMAHDFDAEHLAVVADIEYGELDEALPADLLERAVVEIADPHDVADNPVDADTPSAAVDGPSGGDTEPPETPTGPLVD